MKVYKSIAPWIKFRADVSGQVGFVPTMGALHEGHISLFKKSLNENDFTVGSIFLNPTQFNDPMDLEKYPSTLVEDLSKLKALGVDAVLTPTFKDIYPDNYHYKVSEDELSQHLCGASRPGHFDGVLTVVIKLLNIIQPKKAYFGEKDFQQLTLIKNMVRAFFIPVEIIAAPTIRESDGLAMSSRNALLSPAQREQAAQLHKVISSNLPIKEMKQVLTESGFALDYLDQYENRLFVAAGLGKVRLIDNVKR